MGFWPFGGGKKSRTNTTEDVSRSGRSEKAVATAPTAQGTERYARQSPNATRDNGQQDRGNKPAQLTKSRSQLQSREDVAPSSATTSDPRSPSQLSQLPRTGAGSATTRPLYLQNPTSQSSIGPENFDVVAQPPTLKARRSDYDPTIPRRKSSKRKAEDIAREREVRALASSPIPVPKRPATYSGIGPLRRESRNVPGDLNRRLNRPTSEISLPYPESFSEMDEMAAQSSFKIGMLAALSPRPTLKYDSNPRLNVGKQAVRTPLAVRQAIEEEEGPSQTRIDELADDLDAKGLRELMERDHRRKERKKEADKAKLHRKLQRRAERQREEELRQKAESSQPSSPSTPRRGDQSPLEGSSRYPYTDPRTPSSRVYDSPTKRLEKESLATRSSSKRTSLQQIRNPFEDERDMDLMADSSVIDDESERPPVPVKSPLRTVESHINETGIVPSTATISPPASPAHRPAEPPNFSQTSIQPREATPEILDGSENDRRASDTSSHHASAWSNFFRRAGRRKPSTSDRGGRTTPSEFSNTSRESFVARKQQPPTTAARTFRYSASATPQRTLSKFKEDLSELPISPPYSRVQSPETTETNRATMTTPTFSQSARQSLSGTFESRSLMTSSSIPTIDRSRADSKLQPRTSTEADVMLSRPTDVILSQSLASVDSEGSWLSGKPLKRASGPTSHPLRQSRSSLQTSVPGAYQAEGEDTARNDSLGRLPPAPEDRRESGVSNPQNMSIVPTTKQRTHRSSMDGNFDDDDDDADEDSDASDHESNNDTEDDKGGIKHSRGDDDDGGQLQETVSIQRAKSIDYKGHARHISAGSARLLDIRRSSTMLDSAPVTPTTTRSPPPEAP